MALRQRRSRTSQQKGNEHYGVAWRVWLKEILAVMSRPALAVPLFVVGILLVILASKQMNFFIDYLETMEINVRRDTFASSFLALGVFLLIWVDILLILKMKTLMCKMAVIATGWYTLLAQVLGEMAIREEGKYYARTNRIRR